MTEMMTFPSAGTSASQTAFLWSLKGGSDGTGPCYWYLEGTTARIVDIISSTEANDPLVRTMRPESTMLVLSSPSQQGYPAVPPSGTTRGHVERLGRGLTNQVFAP